MKKLFLSTLAVVALTFTSCSDDDNDSSMTDLRLNLTGLEDLGANYKYEGWIIVDGNPVSTGVLENVTFPQTFSVDAAQLNSATKFVLSIEPTDDTDPAPSMTKLLAGDFVGTSAAVSTKNMVGDFSMSSGKYILATPTSAVDTDEASGVWFLDNTSGMTAGLNLPTLPEGWMYEGWVVMNNTPVSTGTFSGVAMADSNAATSPYKGMNGNGPAFPGEDFVTGSAAGVTFPTDLRGTGMAVISVEPYPDNSPAPFTLKPLAHMIEMGAMTQTTISMGAGPALEISGTVTR